MGRGEATAAPQNLPAKPAAGPDKQMTPHPLEDSNSHHITALVQRFDMLTQILFFSMHFSLEGSFRVLPAMCWGHAAGPGARLAGWGALGSGDDSEGLLPAAESVLCY